MAQEKERARSIRWERVFEALDYPAMLLDEDHTIIAANPATRRLLNDSDPSPEGKKCYHLFHAPDSRGPPAGCPHRRLLESGSTQTVVMEMETVRGIFLVSSTPIEDGGGGRRIYLHLATDISQLKKEEAERRRLEQQLFHTEKMDAIGRMASGIAHDFNNLLSAILGFVDLASLELPPGHRARSSLDEVRSAGRRAAELTRQLLALGRRDAGETEVLDLGQEVARSEALLRRVITEPVAIDLAVPRDPVPIRGNATQLQQVLLNLALNARDAMPKGGRLAIRVGEVELHQAEEAFYLRLAPGPYAALEVGDNGKGMDEQIRAHLFEPFFTTKPRNRGTGLGLATVHNIVKHHGGGIQVDSAPGRGTSIKILFPRCFETPARPAVLVERERAGFSPQVVLVVEDDDSVRRLACHMLRANGFSPVEARTAGEAIACAGASQEPIHLLLADVILPDRDGMTLAEELKTRFPALRVLLMSGYTDDVMARHGIDRRGIAFLRKPFSVTDLLEAVQRASGSS